MGTVHNGLNHILKWTQLERDSANWKIGSNTLFEFNVNNIKERVRDTEAE